jgi:hypothetical protein
MASGNKRDTTVRRETFCIIGLQMSGRRSLDSSAGTAMEWTARVRFLAVQGLFLLHSVETNCGAHPASYPMSTMASIPPPGGGGE